MIFNIALFIGQFHFPFYLNYLYILRLAEKESTSFRCVELIFIVKHNNIHLLLPHLLHADSIAKVFLEIGGGGKYRAIPTSKNSTPQKVRNTHTDDTFSFSLIRSYLRDNTKNTSISDTLQCFEMLASECDNRCLTA